MRNLGNLAGEKLMQQKDYEAKLQENFSSSTAEEINPNDPKFWRETPWGKAWIGPPHLNPAIRRLEEEYRAMMLKEESLRATFIIPQFHNVYVRTMTGQLDANDSFFPLEETVRKLMSRFGASAKREIEFDMSGPDVYLNEDETPAVIVMLTIPKGANILGRNGEIILKVQQAFEIHAGVLADFFARNPEDRFPPTEYGNTKWLSLPEWMGWDYIRKEYDYFLRGGQIEIPR